MLNTRLQLFNSLGFHSPLHHEPYIFSKRQLWTAGRLVKHTHSVSMKPRCYILYRMRPGNFLLKYPLTIREKTFFSWQHISYLIISLENPTIRLCMDCTFTHMQVIHTMDIQIADDNLNVFCLFVCFFLSTDNSV